MPRPRKRNILKRQLEARAQLWPELTDRMVWNMDNEGWVALPRLMPLMLSIMDDLSEKGFPVSRTYLELWSRLREEQFLTLSPEEMAFHAGFEGQRMVRTWKDRVERLAQLGFIAVKPGHLGPATYAVFFNPYHVIKRAFLQKQVQENKWQALVVRANEVGAFDLEDIDNTGALVVDDDEDEEEEGEVVLDFTPAKKPPKKLASSKPKRSLTRKRAR
jgi:hypothetical protein